MAGGRKSKPRVRNKRPIGLKNADSPSRKIPVPGKLENGWFVKEPVASRLYQKSAIGVPTEGGIIINDEELMFCHWHRHLPLPENWLENKLNSEPDFVHQIVAYDTIRSSGDKLVSKDGVWHLWNREHHPSNSMHTSEVKWFRSKDTFDLDSIIDWTIGLEDSVNSDIAIVDEEMDVTMYRVRVVDPKGELVPSTKDNHPNLGVEHLSRVFYRDDEIDWMNDSRSSVTELFSELNSRGLLVRPGFKYGCRWRVYSTPIEQDHAPWLMQMSDDVSSNWEGVCLSVRLAEGVNKSWVIAFKRDGWNFIQFRRHLPGR